MTAQGPLRLVIGEEELLRSRAVATVLAQARAEDPDCDVRESAAVALGVADLMDLLSPSLFAQRRVLVISDAQEAGKEVIAAVLGYVADPVAEITVVVVHSGAAKNRPFVSSLREAGAVVTECPKLKYDRDRLSFIRAEISSTGGRIQAAAAAALLDAVGNDLRELAAACHQLVFDTAGQIDTAAVGRYHRGRAAVTGFTVAERAVVGDGSGALEALRWAFLAGVPNVVLADALADGVRTVARVRSAGRTDQTTLARALGMPPWKVEKAQKQSAGWTDRGLHDAMQIVAEVNAEVKGSAADPDYALERAVRRIAEAHAGR